MSIILPLQPNCIIFTLHVQIRLFTLVSRQEQNFQYSKDCLYSIRHIYSTIDE